MLSVQEEEEEEKKQREVDCDKNFEEDFKQPTE